MEINKVTIILPLKIFILLSNLKLLILNQDAF